MSAYLDVATQLLNLSGGRLLPEEPAGYASLSAPRRTARGREHDTLLLCLGLRSREAVPAARYDELMELAAGTFYGTPGSVTSALRQGIAAVNQNLLDGNRLAGTGPGNAPLQGGVIAAVLRGADFYAVQCGPGLLLVAREAGHERFPQTPTTRALGLSNSVDVLYFHTTVGEGEYVCLSNAPARGWTDIALVGLGSLDALESVAGRLKETASTEASALVGRFESAGGAAPLHSAVAPRPVAASSPAAPRQRATAPVEAQPVSLPPETHASPPPERPQPAARPAGLASFLRLRRPAPPAGTEDNGAAVAPSPHFEAAPDGGAASSLPPFMRGTGQAEPPPKQLTLEPEIAAAPSHSAAGASARRGLRAMARAVGVTLSEAFRGIRLLLGRLMPEGTLQKEGLFTVPTSVQVGIAILIPVLVVGVSVWLYLESGRNEQYVAALSAAQYAVASGRASPDELSARPHWEAALNWLAQAEALRPAQPDVAILRQEAQTKLDALDWVTRLDFQPLLPLGLGRDAHIKQILVAGPDVYALEETRNQVYRLMPIAGGEGYTIDEAFDCAGGRPVGDVNVAQLIDIALVNGGVVAGGTQVVAFDSVGALLYCEPGGQLPSASYLTAPDTGWIRPLALEMYTDRLYVLDPGASDIWQYESSGGAFTQPPSRYFTAVSYDFTDVIDFTIAGGDVFLLHKDGSVSSCSRQVAGGAPSCIETAQYTDNRTGGGVTDTLAGLAAPKLVTFDPPPEPSLYLLDGGASALYQLSLRLSLVRQYRPFFPLPAPISAVAFDPGKRFFVAAGDNVYLAGRP